MNTIQAWWVESWRTASQNSRLERRHYWVFCLFVLLLSVLLVYTIASDVHPMIHHHVVILTHAQWLKRVQVAVILMALMNAFFVFLFVNLYRYGTEATRPQVSQTTTDKAKGEAALRRSFLVYAVLFALSAVAMAAKHKPSMAIVFLGFALLNSAGVALYFRLRAKRSVEDGSLRRLDGRRRDQ